MIKYIEIGEYSYEIISEYRNIFTVLYIKYVINNGHTNKINILYNKI